MPLWAKSPMPCAASSGSIRRRSRFSRILDTASHTGSAMKLILASASPRRAQILRDAGLRFELAQANVSERRKRGETARLLTRRLAQAKAHTRSEERRVGKA